MDKIYNSKLITVKSGASLREARDIMAEKRIRHLPVVDDTNRIIGMLSSHDVSDVFKLQEKPVDLFSRFPIYSVAADQPLSSVAFMMLDKKISSVIVANGSEAVGIITSEDLLYQLATSLEAKEQAQLSPVQKGIITVGEFCRRLAEAGI